MLYMELDKELTRSLTNQIYTKLCEKIILTASVAAGTILIRPSFLSFPIAKRRGDHKPFPLFLAISDAHLFPNVLYVVVVHQSTHADDHMLGVESPRTHHFSAEHACAQLILHFFHQDSVDFLLRCMREAATAPLLFSLVFALSAGSSLLH
ncbi:hypothetical protein [Oscillibacter sp.]|uniref:hypothetical protein n=1 Tax=Oscillibacter sp. TaxID=1945593 RepID=UPI003393BD61